MGGIPEIVRNELNGLLVPPGDSQALTDAILRILNSEILAGRLSRNAALIVKEEFDWDRICEKIYGEYASLVNDRRQPRL